MCIFLAKKFFKTRFSGAENENGIWSASIVHTHLEKS